jgi:hypothetical protein
LDADVRDFDPVAVIHQNDRIVLVMKKLEVVPIDSFSCEGVAAFPSIGGVIRGCQGEFHSILFVVPHVFVVTVHDLEIDLQHNPVKISLSGRDGVDHFLPFWDSPYHGFGSPIAGMEVNGVHGHPCP